MKKLLIGLLAIGSISSYANCELRELRIGNDFEITSTVLDQLEEKGYTINPTYSSPYGSVMVNEQLDEGYDVFIGEQVMIATPQRQREGNRPVKMFLRDVGDGVTSLFDKRTKNSMVRKIKKTGYNRYKVSHWAGKTKSRLAKLSTEKSNDKILSWGLKNLPACDKVGHLKY